MRFYGPFLILASLWLTGCAASGSMLKSGDHVVFFGDSITQQGAAPNGYVSQVRDSLASKGIKVTGAGISGNKIDDLLGRLDRDVLSKQPTTVVVYIGINDVWHWTMPNHKGTTPEAFEAGLNTLVDRLQANNLRILLCTPSVIGEKQAGTNANDTELDRYANISRKVAREQKIQVCDLRRGFESYLKTNNPGNAEKGILTSDGVHLNPAGNTFVAREMLRALRNDR